MMRPEQQAAAEVVQPRRTVARPPLGELMVQAGLLTDEQLETALRRQAETGHPIGQIFVELGFASAAAVGNALAVQYGGRLRTEYGVAADEESAAAEEPAEAADAEPPSPDARVAELEAELAAARDELDGVRAELARARHDLAAAETREQRLGAVEEELAEARREAAATAGELAARGRALQEAEAQLHQLEDQIVRRDDRIAELEQRLANALAAPGRREESPAGARLALVQGGDGAAADAVRWSVRVLDGERRDAFRDYCLRLGAEVTSEGDSFHVCLPGPDGDDLGPYFLGWVDRNECELDIRLLDADAAPVEPAREQPAAPHVRMVPAPADPSSPAAETDDPPKPRLGDLLVAKGLISRDQLVEALNESRSTGVMLGRVLLAKQWVFEEELARTLSEQWDVPYVSLMRVGVDRGAARLLPRQVGLDAAAIPVRRGDDGSVLVAFADPTDDACLEAVERYIQTFTPVIADLSDIVTALRSTPE